jgi:hypothetical protein
MRTAAIGALALTLFGAPAAAQGLFDMLFGGAPRAPRGYVPPQGSAYADPRQYGGERHYGERPAAPSYGSGRSVSYCVRLCDGRFFPVQRSGNASSAQLCSALCPASKTQVFNGSQIDHAVASNGARYADLDNAFVYREKLVDGCTCNGRTAFGLARIDAASDPTLRQGDIIATADGTTRVNNAHVTRTARANRAAARSAARAVPDDDDLPED